MKDRENAAMTSSNKKRWLALAAVVAMITIIVGCDDNRVYSSYHAVDSEGWDKANIETFDIPPIKQTADYEQAIGLRINSYYPFLSLNLIIEQTIFPSFQQVVDTIDCRLIQNDGKHIGYGQSLWQQEVPLRKIKLHEGDSLSIKIRHNMRRDILRGVSDVGLIMNHAE